MATSKTNEHSSPVPSSAKAEGKFTVEQELQICKKQADIYVKYYRPSLFKRHLDGIYINPMDFDNIYKLNILK